MDRRDVEIVLLDQLYCWARSRWWLGLIVRRTGTNKIYVWRLLRLRPASLEFELYRTVDGWYTLRCAHLAQGARWYSRAHLDVDPADPECLRQLRQFVLGWLWR